jgi:outer membrane murein-binding lipoprotein Lpp
MTLVTRRVSCVVICLKYRWQRPARSENLAHLLHSRVANGAKCLSGTQHPQLIAARLRGIWPDAVSTHGSYDMKTSLSTLCTFAAGIAGLALLAGCTATKATKEAVAKAETQVQQVQAALGNNEASALDVQRAKDHLAQAKQAVDKGDDKPAVFHAKLAELDAELAVAKQQHATARKSADELQASIQQLRQESQRTIDTAR